MATTRDNLRPKAVRQTQANDKASRSTSRRESTPHPVRWTRAQYYRMGKLGWFEGKRVELLEGEIVQMSPMNDPHWWAIVLTERALRGVFGDEFLVVSQLPIALSTTSEPEPDVAVIKATLRERSKPKTAALVVEVSDTTLRLDQTTKAQLYAQAGIIEYWIINLKARQLEVRRDPGAKGYSETTTLKADGEVSPLSSPESKIKIADLLP